MKPSSVNIAIFRLGGLLIPLTGLIILSSIARAEMTADQRAAVLAPTTEFDAPEQWEALPGGSATNRKRFDRDAFSQPSGNLSFSQRADFFLGNGLFRRLWVTAPASTRTADGLGPYYNARACQRCHLKDGRGHTPANPTDEAISMFLRLSVPPKTESERQQLSSGRAAVIPEPTYGGQLQDLAIPGFKPEGRMSIRYKTQIETFHDGETISLRNPSYGMKNLAHGPMREDVMLSPRVAPVMIGLGLLEAVSQSDILANADPDDADGDGISGRPNRVWSLEQNRVMLGRFGWKAGQPSLAEQNAGAMAGDIGVSNPLHPMVWGDCTAQQAACRAAPHGGDTEDDSLEATGEMMELILFYTQHLAVPARRSAGEPEVLRGKELFYNAGCTGCHIPKFATASDHPVFALAGQLIWPYSDLLLHDMGPGLADNRPEGLANGQEWRTPPLWGIGLTKTVSGHTQFLHDGRARNLTEAILWHDGEAKASRNAFADMQKSERNALLQFLESL